MRDNFRFSELEQCQLTSGEKLIPLSYEPSGELGYVFPGDTLYLLCDGEWRQQDVKCEGGGEVPDCSKTSHLTPGGISISLLAALGHTNHYLRSSPGRRRLAALFPDQHGTQSTCASYCEGSNGQLPNILDAETNNRLAWQMHYHGITSMWIGK